MINNLRLNAVKEFTYSLSRSGNYYRIVGNYAEGHGSLGGGGVYFAGLVYTDDEAIPAQIVRDLNSALVSGQHANTLMQAHRHKTG